MTKRFASHSIEDINAKKQTLCQRTPQKQIIEYCSNSNDQ